jgi:hypothetical protein
MGCSCPAFRRAFLLATQWSNLGAYLSRCFRKTLFRYKSAPTFPHLLSWAGVTYNLPA